MRLRLWLGDPAWPIRHAFRRIRYWVVINELGRYPHVGQLVCDCRYRHLRVVEVLDGDDLVLEDGSYCSYASCCNKVPHPEWDHPDDQPSA